MANRRCATQAGNLRDLQQRLPLVLGVGGKNHLAFRGHQFQIAVAEGADEVLIDRPVVIGRGQQGIAVQTFIVGAQIARQGTDLIVPRLPVIEQLLLLDIGHGFQRVQALLAQRPAGLLVDRESHHHDRDKTDKQVADRKFQSQWHGGWSHSGRFERYWARVKIVLECAGIFTVGQNNEHAAWVNTQSVLHRGFIR